MAETTQLEALEGGRSSLLSNVQRRISTWRWVQQALALRDARVMRDAGLAAARVGLAWVFTYHGASTLFGAFGGAGIHRTAEFFASVAHLHPGTLFAVLNGITEFFGGIAIGLGLLSRLAAAGLFVDMVIAMATVTFHNGIVSNAAGSGYELNVALAALAAVILLLGAGRLSLDAAVGRLSRVDRAPAKGGPS